MTGHCSHPVSTQRNLTVLRNRRRGIWWWWWSGWLWNQCPGLQCWSTDCCVYRFLEPHTAFQKAAKCPLCTGFVILTFQKHTLLQNYLIITTGSYLWVSELAEVRGEVVFQAICSSWECHSTEEEEEQHQVGKCSCEIHHLQMQKSIYTKYGFLCVYGACVLYVL